MTGILPCSTGAVNGGGGRRSARQEREADVPLVVVGVGVDQAYALPGAELEAAFEHRHARVRRDERRDDVVAAVPGAAVPVPPAVVAGEQDVELREQVVVAAGT